MRPHGQRAGRSRSVRSTTVIAALLLVTVVASVAAQEAGVPGEGVHFSSGSNRQLGSGSGVIEVVMTPAPAPSPTYGSDDCSACCAADARGNGTTLGVDATFACCRPSGKSTDLYNTNFGYCVGLPCCSFGGRPSQRGQTWFPCLLFPTCMNDPNKKDFCESETQKSFIKGANFNCTDGCCSGPVLESNVWTNVANALPGQTNGTFAVTFNPSELKRAFFQPTDRDSYDLQQIVLASPPDYKFGKRPNCRLTKTQSNTTTSANCVVSKLHGISHLTVDIPTNYGDHTNNETFTVTFDRVVTPSGVDLSLNATGGFSTSTNLVPVYFLFNTDRGFVYSTFYRLTPMQPSTLTSGSFVPENIYPGNSGNATLSFYSGTAISKGSTIRLGFHPKWGFKSSAMWTWNVLPSEDLTDDLPVTETFVDGMGGSGSSRSSDAEVFAAPLRPGLKPFVRSKFNANDNQWILEIDQSWQPGWVFLSVNVVQNPTGTNSGLNVATIEVLDAKGRLTSSGTFSSLSVDVYSEPIASPYTYVTIVVLTGTLFFCTVVIRSNGISFSFSSIWTDITAICTLLALITAIINNLVWVIHRGNIYFYLSRIFLCFTFTMLTAVCFHWGTVLNLNLRRVPKVKTVVAFVVVNLMFYGFQAAFLFYHQALITKVYEAESNTLSYASQQCKDGDLDSANSAFSEIQGYMWQCYAQNEDKFFLISTTVTSALFLGLTVLVMALGFMVMRRGKLLLGNSTGPHQLVLVKALRLYYTLIGVVTVVYLLSWVVQLISRGHRAISYPWYYIFTVWLPESIPPCCLIFLQWNSTAKSLKDADLDASASRATSETDIYDEIRTPSIAFSTSDLWSDDDASDILDDDDRESAIDLADAPFTRSQRSHEAQSDDYVGLSMSLETNEDFPHGCFVAIQRLVVDPMTGTHMWRQISNTDTVEASRKDLSGSISSGRHVYSFMAVPRIPLSSVVDDRVRLVVYSVNTGTVEATRTDHHSEMTAEHVLAAMDRRSSGDDEQRSLATYESTCDDSVDMHASQAIDELFEQESEPDSTDGLNSLLTSLSIVAEFTISTDALVTSGARSELITLIAAENSYKQFGLDSIPPKMSVHTVLPKAARTKYGIAGVSSGLVSSHSMSSQYHIRELGLLVVEDLTESRFSNSIPRQILESIIRVRTKQFYIAQNDLARLEAFDRQRQKGTDRGIYENLIQQIQDDGDIQRCREWMIHRCQYIKEYVDLLRRLRRQYVSRDSRKEYFKPSTEKKNSLLRFLPINLHLQEMWVGSATQSINAEESKASVYDIVTVGAMAAHVYKFKNGGILGLQEQHAKMKSRRREVIGSAAAHRQSPMWTEEEQKAETFDWDIQKRMDVCFPQAAAALVTAFTRKIDLALQSSQEDVGREMLHQLEKLGFLFNVESLVSTHGNEAGMLEDMAGALHALRNVRFVLVDEVDLKPKSRDVSLSFDVDEETKEEDETLTRSSSGMNASQSSATSGPLAGVVDVNVFTSLEQALAVEELKRDGQNCPPSPAHSVANSATSFTNVGNRLMNTLMVRARSGRFFSTATGRSAPDTSTDNLYGYTSLVIRVKVRTTRIKLPVSLAYGGTINVTPVLFTQGINEKQTLANNTNLSVTRLQDTINENSLKLLRTYADRYCNYMASVRTRGTCPSVSSVAISREQVTKQLGELDKLISSAKQARKKRPEILQLSSDLCRHIGAGRVTVCKSAKDRTGMSVTLEQGRILVERHGLPASKKAGIVSVMRSEGVRIENAFKNTGRRVFAFNALQRSLLPEEYRCPPQTAGKNVS
jgi:hypothetical protein